MTNDELIDILKWTIEALVKIAYEAPENKAKEWVINLAVAVVESSYEIPQPTAVAMTMAIRTGQLNTKKSKAEEKKP